MKNRAEKIKSYSESIGYYTKMRGNGEYITVLAKKSDDVFSRWEGHIEYCLQDLTILVFDNGTFYVYGDNKDLVTEL